MRRSPYPLQWPSRLPRTQPNERQHSQFGGRDKANMSPYSTGVEVVNELQRLGASEWVITSGLPSKGPGGIPYSDPGRIEDPGIAVWFEFRRVERVFACDRWRTLIAATHPDDPDHGDTTADVAELNAALDEAIAELSP